MIFRANNGFSFKVIIYASVGIIIMVSAINLWVSNSLDTISAPVKETVILKQQEEVLPRIKTKATIENKIDVGGQIIRKTQVYPGSDYFESIYYQDGLEIAREKNTPGGKYEKTGDIPDGKIKFVNAHRNTYGEEHYRWGKKHGLSRIYYSDGSLREEANYKLGELETQKIYYKDGSLRFELDCRDARNYRGDREVGVGKLYYKDGTLKYEWNITNSQRAGFKKSYNTDGTLRVATYYDARGNVIDGE